MAGWTMWLIFVLGVCLWVYLLSVLTRAKLWFWKYLTGTVGVFSFVALGFRQWLIPAIQRAVTECVGFIGDASGWWTTYAPYHALLVSTKESALASFFIDIECSGFIEILAFISMVIFLRFYRPSEKIMLALAGSIILFILDVFRIALICGIVHFGGSGLMAIAHLFIGRLVFYAGSVMLYFYVFTKAQITRQKVGGFNYEHA